MALVQVAVADKIGTIALDNYPKRNSLSQDLVGEVLAAMQTFADDGVRVVVIRAAGATPVWSAGHDIDELPVANEDPLPYSDSLEQLLRTLRRYPGAVIAMVHGSVWGGACDVVLNCDLVIADESAEFAVTPAKLGLPYSETGIQYFVARLPINVVNELLMTAEPMAAERALNFGLINQLVASSELEACTYEVARTIRSRSADSIRVYKEQARIMVEAIALTAQQAQRVHQLRADVYTGPDYNEGIAAFLEKRAPDFG